MTRAVGDVVGRDQPDLVRGIVIGGGCGPRIAGRSLFIRPLRKNDKPRPENRQPIQPMMKSGFTAQALRISAAAFFLWMSVPARTGDLVFREIAESAS